MGRKPKFKDYPGVRELKGGRFVFRHPLVGQRSLPGEIGSDEFAAAYEELRLLVANPTCHKIARRKPTFADAFIEWQKCPEWASYHVDTKSGHQRHAKVFLEARISDETMATFGEVEIATPEEEILPLLRSHVASYAPHKAKRVAILIRKLYTAAVSKKWCLRNLGRDIEQHKLPKPKGHMPWPAEYLERFENFHKLGSAARTAYALARYVGNRRGDVALVSWDQLHPYRYIDESTGEVRVVTVLQFWTSKDENNGGNEFVTVVVRPELQEVLDALDRSKGGTILKTHYGKPFSQKSLTNQMAVWCEQADVPPGYTLHGLRSSYANEMAEGGADPFAVQKALGHTNIRTTQIYLKKLDATPMALRAAEAAARRAAQIRRIRDSEK